jgi:hypothetical protein
LRRFLARRHSGKRSASRIGRAVLAHCAAFFSAVILASAARPESGGRYWRIAPPSFPPSFWQAQRVQNRAGGIMGPFNEFSFYPLLPE